jgi:cupin fold WbuC family metalloprotein
LSHGRGRARRAPGGPSHSVPGLVPSTVVPRPPATRSPHRRFLPLTEELIRSKARDAAGNPRRREIHVLHAGDDDPLQRMLNALQPGSYVRPHRHRRPPKAEAVVLLQGALGFAAFEDDGQVAEGGLVLVERQRGIFGVDWRAGLWHTFFALVPDTVVFEVKSGPWDPATDKEWAPWSPEEGTLEGTRYLAALEDALRERYGLGPRVWTPLPAGP